MQKKRCSSPSKRPRGERRREEGGGERAGE